MIFPSWFPSDHVWLEEGLAPYFSSNLLPLEEDI